MFKVNGRIDKSFLLSVIILTTVGFFIFSSASLGVLASNESKFSNVAFSQFFFGLFLGSIVCFIASKINYEIWKKYSFYIFIISVIATLLVFAPIIGIEHGGAKRWLDLGFITFQPSELLKIAYIFYFAAWLSSNKEKVKTWKEGFLPFLIISGIVGITLLAQPDTDTFAVTVFAGLAMYIAAGCKWSHIFFVGIMGIVLLTGLAFTRPYVMQRIKTLMNPSANAQTSGYQLQQSMIAVGSGKIYGKGFGQSIQKFRYLPEPVGDSVFAVAAEEFGFLGAILLLALFIFFTIKGLKISSNSKDSFGGLVTLGIVILIISQAFVNIGGMIGILPLTGIPLPFVSHGGTALLMTLFEVGVIMNISRGIKTKQEKLKTK